MRYSMVLLALLCATPMVAPAQEGTLRLEPGDRVRVAPVPGGVLATASVVGVTPNAVSLAFHDAEARVVQRPYAGIDLIRVSQGTSRRASARYAGAFGAFVLGSAGVAFGPLAAQPLDWPIGRALATFAAVGAVGGGTVGAAFGAATAGERWKSYTLRR